MNTIGNETRNDREPFRTFPAADTTKRARYAPQTAQHIVFVGSGTTSNNLILLTPEAHRAVAVGMRSFKVTFTSNATQTGFLHNPVDFDVNFRARIEQAVAKRVQKEKNKGAAALLRAWLKAEDAEARDQRETLELLSKTLDEDRHSARKLF